MQIIANCDSQTLEVNNKIYDIAIGKKGYCDISSKIEGDNKTPLGEYKILSVWYRLDKIKKLSTLLPLKVITKSDGWCDDPKSPNYNQHIKLPSNYSHEQLYKDSDIYDLILTIDYNTNPIVKNRGSAIFIHIARDKYLPTEGCIALKKTDLLEIIENLTTNSKILIRP